MSGTWLDTHWSWVDIRSTLAEIIPTSSRIWNAVISVDMVVWSKKALRCSIRAVYKSSIFFSVPPSISFNARIPESSTFTLANEVGEDNVQNRESFAYDWIKSQQLQTSCSMRVRIWACLDSGLIDFKVSS